MLRTIISNDDLVGEARGIVFSGGTAGERAGFETGDFVHEKLGEATSIVVSVTSPQQFFSQRRGRGFLGLEVQQTAYARGAKLLYLEGHLESVVNEEPTGKYVSLVQKELDHFGRLCKQGKTTEDRTV